MKKILFLIVFITLLIAGIYFYQKYHPAPAQTQSTVATSTDTTASSTSTTTQTETQTHSNTSGALASVMVYKTKGDYSNLVWVQLSADKKTVTAYPDPKDVLKQTPIKLTNGYYSGGVGVNTAFVNIRIEKYVKFKTLFSPEQLATLIVNRNPFSELYNCGASNGTGQDITRINSIIESGSLSTSCTKII